MLWKLGRNTLIFMSVLVLFILILLLPKETEITGFGVLWEAEYPFTLAIYQENINDFIQYFKEEKGFGTTPGGVPLLLHMVNFLQRSLKIIIPSFILSLTIGTALGVLLFYIRNKKRGRALSFMSWIFDSIPDFFLFIAIQFLLTLAMKHGFPKFNLYSSDDWYSYIIPCISLTIFPLFHMVKLTATTMEVEVGEEYVRTALAKGMTQQRVLVHIFWNAWSTIINQSHIILLYILSSLPIIEKLSNYNGAGYQLLESVLNNEAIRAVVFFLPFLILLYIVVLLAHLFRKWLLPEDVMEI